MSYCTLDDIKKDYPEAWISQTSDDDMGENVDESVVSAAIARADADIDAWLDGVYTVPFTTVPEIIKFCSVDLAFFYLYRRRLSGEAPEWVQDVRKMAEEKLIKLKAGELSLPAVESENDADGIYLSNKTEDDRIFTNTKLDAFFEEAF
jgi:phage gp36-like protein